MKRFRSTLFALALIPLFASTPSIAYEDEIVTLQSQDGQDFKIEVRVAKKSETIENLMDDAGIENPIPLPNVRGNTLAKLVEFMKRATEQPFKSDQAMRNYLREFLSEKNVSTKELFDIVVTANYLGIKSQENGDALPAFAKVYGDRLFGHVELENLKRVGAQYAAYAEEKLNLPKELQKIIVRESFHNIDRIFLDTTPDRRIHALEQTPLRVAQIIAYIAKNQIARAAELPPVLRDVLVQWQGENFADKIHFGPWPTEIATWPGHCPLPSDPNYNMYSDATPDDRYVDNGDGTVTDICTKLTWEQSPSTTEYDLRKAITHCTQLNEGTAKKKRKTEKETETNAAQTNWRAPTRIELQSIVNYAAQTNWQGTNPALNPIFKEGNARFWSSTPAIGYRNEVWAVNFQTGVVANVATAEKRRMRCVFGERGGTQTLGAKNHYAYAHNSETVLDNFTGAVWQRGVIDEARDHFAAQTYCMNLVLVGPGWNLPTVKALSTLIDVGLDSPRIDRVAFPVTPLPWYWASSIERGSRAARIVDFDEGDVASAFVGNIGQDSRVRCVR